MAKVGRFSPSSVAQDWVGKGNRTARFSEERQGVKEFPTFQSQTSSETQSHGSSESSDTPPYVSVNNANQYVSAFNQMQGPNKCRQLPCRTFISTGSCPYSEKCVFLHSNEIVSKPIFIKIKRKSKDETGTDTFFWPTMPLGTVMSKLDARNQPDIAQSYIVPAPGSYSTHSSINDSAVFSMWEYFLDFLATDSLSVVTQPRAVPPLNPYQANNRFTGKSRLPVFRNLSQGIPLV